MLPGPPKENLDYRPFVATIRKAENALKVIPTDAVEADLDYLISELIGAKEIADAGQLAPGRTDVE